MAHITVTPAEEDEVIFAGMRAEPPTGTAGATGTAGTAGTAGTVTAGDNAVQLTDSEGSGGTAGRNRVPSNRKEPDASRETTLEDLEPAPMPLAQRIVIVAAVVCIIGALVYYFVAMR